MNGYLVKRVDMPLYYRRSRNGMAIFVPEIVRGSSFQTYEGAVAICISLKSNWPCYVVRGDEGQMPLL